MESPDNVPRLTPPGPRAGKEDARNPRSIPAWFWPACAALLLIALGVVILLPSVAEKAEKTKKAATAATAATAGTAGTAEIAGISPRVDPPVGDSREPVLQAPAARAEPVDAVGMDVGSAEDTLTTVSPEATDAAEAAGETEAQETFAEIAVEPEPDPDRQTAREAEFRAAMTGFLTALKAGDLEQAAGALAKARELNPGAPVLGDAGRRLESAKKERELQRLARQGRQSEASEDWQQAIAIYTRAIALSPNASFAGEGKRRAGERLELRKKLDHYLGDPGRLQADQPRANALLLLEHLERIPNPGPRLSADRARLADLLAAAVRPVTLRIRSDEQTEVTIYRVGRLGRFLQHEIELRPGNYTVVGYREGFRDVRRKISLRPGVEAEIQVRCEERI